MTDPWAKAMMTVQWFLFAGFTLVWLAVSSYLLIVDGDPASLWGGGIVVLMYAAVMTGLHLGLRWIDKP